MELNEIIKHFIPHTHKHCFVSINSVVRIKLSKALTLSLPFVQTPCWTIPNSPTPNCLFTQIESAGMMCLLFGILLGELVTLIASVDVAGLSVCTNFGEKGFIFNWFSGCCMYFKHRVYSHILLHPAKHYQRLLKTMHWKTKILFVIELNKLLPKIRKLVQSLILFAIVWRR